MCDIIQNRSFIRHKHIQLIVTKQKYIYVKVCHESEAQLRLASMCFYIAMEVSDYVLLLYSHEAESQRLACVVK